MRSPISRSGSIASTSPNLLVSTQDEVRVVATALLLATTAAMLLLEIRSAQSSLPRLLYTVGLAVMVGIAPQLRSLFIRPWARVALLVAISVLLLPVFEVEAVGQGNAYYGDRIFGAISTALRTSTWVPALIALGFATGFTHYLLDRSVYRFSNAQVRMAASGLAR